LKPRVKSLKRRFVMILTLQTPVNAIKRFVESFSIRAVHIQKGTREPGHNGRILWSLNLLSSIAQQNR